MDRSQHDYRAGVSQVDYHDLSNMARTQQTFRSRWIPRWALNDQRVRLVVYNYVFNYVRKVMAGEPQPGASLMQLETIARTLAREKLKRSSSSPYLNIQEHLRTSENGIASRAASLIYKAYRERLKAPDIAGIMEMTPDAVRQLLFRLNRTARKLFPAEECLPLEHWSRKPLTNKRASQCLRNGRSRRKGNPRMLPYVPTKALADKFNAGATLAKLSKECGIPVATISWRIRKYQGQLKRTNRGQFLPLVMTPELEELAYWHKAAGISIKQLAMRTDIPYGTLVGRFRKFGLV